MDNQMENAMETAGVYMCIYFHIGVILGLRWGHIGIMEKKMETTQDRVQKGVILGYWSHIGIMEKRMETSLVYRVYIGVMLGGIL